MLCSSIATDNIKNVSERTAFKFLNKVHCLPRLDSIACPKTLPKIPLSKKNIYDLQFSEEMLHKGIINPFLPQKCIATNAAFISKHLPVFLKYNFLKFLRINNKRMKKILSVPDAVKNIYCKNSKCNRENLYSEMQNLFGHCSGIPTYKEDYIIKRENFDGKPGSNYKLLSNYINIIYYMCSQMKKPIS